MEIIVSIQNAINSNITKLEDYKKTHKAIYTTFRSLLYPYKIDDKDTNTKIGKNINIPMDESIMDIVNVKDLVFMPKTYLDDDFIIHLNDAELANLNKKEELTVVKISKVDYIISILNEYYRNLYTLIEFIEIYDTKEKIVALSKVWNAYNILKKPKNF
jgi:hypothetical protein